MKKLNYRGNILIIIIIVLLGVGGYSYYEENSASRTKYITILHTNDVHGRIEPFKYEDKKGLIGGMARRAALIKALEGSNENVVTVDAGDFAQGSLFFNIFSGIPDVKLMHAAGYDIATLGNHEFDKGLKVTKEIVKQSEFPFVCANIRFTGDKELQEMIKPYVIKDYNEVKVAFIGLISEQLKILANKLDDVEILDSVKTGREIAEKINSEVDLIVVISHMGEDDDIELAKAVPEIDVIIGGHSHTFIEQPRIYNEKQDKTLVLQGGEFGVYLGRLDISVKDKEIQSYYYSFIPVDEQITADVDIQKKVKILAKEIEKYKHKKIGKLVVAIGDEDKNIRKTLMKKGSLVTEAIKYRFPEVDVVLQNSGGIRLNRQIGPGDITLADILELYPFENTIVTLELKGSDLKSVLETSSRRYPRSSGGFLQSLGLEYTINTDKPHQVLSENGLEIITPGNRVSDIKINEAPLESDKYYIIAVNDYMYNGGNGYSQFERAKNVLDTGILVQDVIEEYLQEKSPVSPEVRDRIHVK